MQPASPATVSSPAFTLWRLEAARLLGLRSRRALLIALAVSSLVGVVSYAVDPGDAVATPVDGQEVSRFDDGSVRWVVGRFQGRLDGEERWYDSHGTLRRIGTWRAGVRDGTFSVFGADGRMMRHGQYVDGVRIAEQID